MTRAAVIPAAVGTVIARRIRRMLSETRFRTVYFAGNFALGACMIFTPVQES